MSSRTYYIHLDSLKIRAFHGVFREEEEIGNTFEFQLKVGVEAKGSFDTDQLEDTVDYVSLIKLIKMQNAKRSKTLENLGERIIQELFKQYPSIRSIHLKINKIDPPITDEIRSVGIEMEESRKD